METKEKATKITNEELNQVQSLVSDMNKYQLEIGSMETRKYSFLKQVSILQESLGKLQSELEKVYGTADVNIQDGTINYRKDEQTN